MPKAKRAPADPERFQEASDWFRGRVAVTPAEWRAMNSAERRQAFTVAGAQSLRVVQAVLDALQVAIDSGVPLAKWRKDLKRDLKRDFASIDSAHLTTAFINAHQTAYATGRYYQLSDPSVTSAMPYLMVDAILDNRTTALCRGLNGTIRRHDDPWWLTHWNPYHHRCRTTIRALTESMAKRRGGVTEKLPRPPIPDDWGLAPPLRAGQVWEPKREDFDPSAWAIYEASQQRMRARRANDNDGK